MGLAAETTIPNYNLIPNHTVAAALAERAKPKQKVAAERTTLWV